MYNVGIKSSVLEKYEQQIYFLTISVLPSVSRLINQNVKNESDGRKFTKQVNDYCKFCNNVNYDTSIIKLE